MKLFVVVMIFLWLFCGLAGDWMIDGGGDLHWQKIIRGPITLIQAFNDDPVTIPTQS
jgi:hypothetical protein